MAQFFKNLFDILNNYALKYCNNYDKSFVSAETLESFSVPQRKCQSIFHKCSRWPVLPDVRIKSSPISTKVVKKVATAIFTLNLMLFKNPKQVSKYLDYFWIKICCHLLSKIAQSGCAGCGQKLKQSPTE